MFTGLLNETKQKEIIPTTIMRLTKKIAFSTVFLSAISAFVFHTCRRSSIFDFISIIALNIWTFKPDQIVVNPDKTPGQLLSLLFATPWHIRWLYGFVDTSGLCNIKDMSKLSKYLG